MTDPLHVAGDAPRTPHHAALVSVIVPAYDRERWLGETLASIAAQTYRPLEVVVVDDGSTDGTAEVARSFPSVRCLRQPNQGVAAARNAGVRATTGSLLAFLDADDLWLPGKLELQVAYLEENPHIGYCLTRMRNVLEPGCARPEWTGAPELDRDVIGASPCTMLVRRSVFDQVGAFDPKYRTGEDVDWFFRARDAGVPFAILEPVTVLRRIHASNLSAARAEGDPGLARLIKASLDRRRNEPRG